MYIRFLLISVSVYIGCPFGGTRNITPTSYRCGTMGPEEINILKAAFSQYLDRVGPSSVRAPKGTRGFLEIVTGVFM